MQETHLNSDKKELKILDEKEAENVENSDL